MRILAIDTALEACSVAVFDTGERGMLARASRPMQRGHAEALMPMLASAMDEAGIDFSELDRIAVTAGPGSFTGLRVGISAARAIGLAAAKPVVALSTLSAYAAPHIAADDRATIAVAIDARHAQVYLQIFGAGGRTLLAPRIASIVEAAQLASAGGTRIAGSAAGLVAAAWTSSGRAPIVDQQSAPDIEWVARLGVAAAADQAPPKPLYLRAPDAQPQDAARLPRR